MIDVDDLLTVDETAQLLDIRPRSVYTAVAEGRLPAIRKGKRGVLIRREDAEAYKNAPKHAGGRPKKAATPST